MNQLVIYSKWLNYSAEYYVNLICCKIADLTVIVLYVLSYFVLKFLSHRSSQANAEMACQVVVGNNKTFPLSEVAIYLSMPFPG